MGAELYSLAKRQCMASAVLSGEGLSALIGAHKGPTSRSLEGMWRRDVWWPPRKPAVARDEAKRFKEGKYGGETASIETVTFARKMQGVVALQQFGRLRKSESLKGLWRVESESILAPPRKLAWLAYWKITIVDRRYIFIHGWLSIVILVFRAVNSKISASPKP